MVKISLFLCVVLATLKFLIAAPPTELPLYNVDNNSLCEELCVYGLSGSACSVDCTNIIVDEAHANLVVSEKLCGKLCKAGLGTNRCKCKKPENVTYRFDALEVCFDFMFNNVTLESCPRCPFENHFHHGSTNKPITENYVPPKLTDEQRQKAGAWKKLYCDYTCKNNIGGGNYCKCGGK